MVVPLDVGTWRRPGGAGAGRQSAVGRPHRPGRGFRQRRGALRKERRRADGAGGHDPVDDRRCRVRPVAPVAHPPRRQIRRFRICVAHRRRPLARAGDVPRCSLGGARRGSHSRPRHPVGQRRRDHAGRGRLGLVGRLRGADEQARRRAWSGAFAFRQFLRQIGPGAEGHGARHGRAGGGHHPQLSRRLSLFQREGLHLEQDPSAQPQSAAGHGSRRRRTEGVGFGRGRIRPRRLGDGERAAADRRAQWPEERDGAAGRSAQALHLGLSLLRRAGAVSARRHSRRGRRLWRRVERGAADRRGAGQGVHSARLDRPAAGEGGL